KVYIRHCLQLTSVVSPFDGTAGLRLIWAVRPTETVSQRELSGSAKKVGASSRLERFAVRPRALVCPGQLAAGWRQWVALPQREPLTEWGRHQTQSARTTSRTGPTAALARSFGSGFSLSLPSLPFARRNGAETWWCRRDDHGAFA
ncbi:hypothetical protein D4764_18G0003220, partial [Takifugu flavidus]